MHLFLIDTPEKFEGIYLYVFLSAGEGGRWQEEELVQDINDKRNFKGRRMSGILSVANGTQTRPRW